MVNDDELYNSFLRCAGTRGDAAGARRERRCGLAPAAALPRHRRHRSRGPRLFASAGGRRRGHQPRHHDRRHGGLSALRRPHLLPRGPRGDRAGARRRQARVRRAVDPAPAARRGRVSQHGLGLCGAPRDVAAVPAQGRIRRAFGPGCSRARCRSSRPIIAPLPPRRSASAATTSPRYRTAPAASRTGCRCCGPRASIPGGSPRRNSSP